MNPSLSFDDLRHNLVQVQDRIHTACERSHRSPRDVQIIAVTKYVLTDVVQNLIRLGLTEFGENRLQVAAPKIQALAGSPIHWHWIGHLQTNKVRKVLEHFQCIHSIDRLILVQEIQSMMEKKHTDTSARIPVFMQINISGEDSKEGITPADAEKLGEQILQSSHLEWVGLMTMAPISEDPERIRWVFEGLRTKRDELSRRLGIHLPRLSMGMSQDFEVAIEEGATDIRIGSILFGG